MRIFLSYAAEQKTVAEPLAFSLRSQGHNVFLDKDDLPAGLSFDEKIRRAIDASDLFVFLISPESVTKGRYTLTELEFARQKWRSPHRHVLPAMVSPTDLNVIPAFLKGTTILSPQGNVAAEVSGAVERLFGRPSASTAVPLLSALGVACGLVWSFAGEIFDARGPAGIIQPMHFIRGAANGLLFGLVIGYGVWRWGGRSLTGTFVAVILTACVWAIPTRMFTLAIFIDQFRDAGAHYGQMAAWYWSFLGFGLQGLQNAAGALLGAAATVPFLRRPGIWGLTLITGMMASVLTMSDAVSAVVAQCLWDAAVAGAVAYGFSHQSH